MNSEIRKEMTEDRMQKTEDSDTNYGKLKTAMNLEPLNPKPCFESC
jgi:hypothetical protein